MKTSWSGVVLLALALVTTLAASPAHGQDGLGKKRRPLPSEYGRVVLNEGSEKAQLAPVVFEHWLHRAKFTCRLCHVDIGFAMKANATHIKAADNEAGVFCGACHDGKTLVDGRKVFSACSSKGGKDGCIRCHSQGKAVKLGNDFASFTRDLPRGRFGNGVDWEAAEERHLIAPIDFLESVSIKRTAMAAQKDFALSPTLAGMPEIIFSHAKHTVWSGCEGCHPDIFAVKKGSTKYTMLEIFDGKYCGACHQSVAFPTLDCQRCHTKAVQ